MDKEYMYMRLWAITGLAALAIICGAATACDIRTLAFWQAMAEKNFCRTVIGDKELWRPCGQVNP